MKKDVAYIEVITDKLPNILKEKEYIESLGMVVVFSAIDKTKRSYCISAPRDILEKKMPDFLDEELIRKPDYEGFVEGRFGNPFLEYNEENIGVHHAFLTKDSKGDFYYHIEKIK